MSKVNEMSMEEFTNNIVLTIRATDGYFFYKDSKKGIEFFNLLKNKNISNVAINNFLIDNDEDIDREKLLTIIIKRAKETIEDFEQQLAENIGNKNETSIRAKIDYIKKSITKMKKLGSDIDKIIPTYIYDHDTNEYQIEIIDSKKEINGLKYRNEEAVKKFEQADEFFRIEDSSTGEYEDGIENLFIPIVLTDFYYVFKPTEIADVIRTRLVENDLIKKGKKTYTEIEELKSQENINEYLQITENRKYDYTILKEIRQCFEDCAEYLDVDKLFVICAYRFNKMLENNKIPKEYMPSFKHIFLQLLEYCKTNNLKKEIHYAFQNPDNNCEFEYVDFNLDDFEKNTRRIIDEKYYSEEDFEEFRNNLLQGQRELNEYEAEDLMMVLSKEEIDNIARKSGNNLFYIATDGNWKAEKILEIAKNIENIGESNVEELFRKKLLDEFAIKELYIEGKISIQFLLNIVDKEKLKMFIKPKEFIKQYKNEENEKLERSLELLKNISENLDDEEKQKIQSEIISNIKGNFNKKAITTVLADMYSKGAVGISTIYEKCGEDVLNAMLKENKIQIEDLLPLIKDKKISPELLMNMYEKYVFDNDLSYDARLDIIKKGIISEDIIVRLYNENYILKSDLDMLLSNGIIGIEKYNIAINGKDLDTIKEEIPLNFDGINIDISGLEKVQYVSENEKPDININPTHNEKIIINPPAREDFIKMFGASLVPDRATNRELNEDSPFYNYEFYIIPNKAGKIDSECIVIAERYYKNRDVKTKFSTNNATYFFRLGDMPTFSKLSKKEILEGREGAIYRAKHILYKEKINDDGEIEATSGYWATGTLYGIAKAMLNTDLTGKSKDEIRVMVIDKLLEVYGEKRLQEILNEIEKIDGGEYNVEIIDERNHDADIR